MTNPLLFKAMKIFSRAGPGVPDYSWGQLDKAVQDLKELVGKVIANAVLIPIAIVVHRLAPDESKEPGPYASIVVLDPRNFAVSFAAVRQISNEFGGAGVVVVHEAARIARFGPAEPAPLSPGDVLSDPTRERTVVIMAQHESGRLVMWNAVVAGKELSDWEEVSDDSAVPGYMTELVRTKH